MSQIGRTAEVRWRVPRPMNPRANANGLSAESHLPAIPANSRLVELMESAAVKLVKPWLRPGESTLAVKLDVTHLRPLSRDTNVRAVATYVGGAGRLHHFTIHAFDDTGLIASCDHTRAVVGARHALADVRPPQGGPPVLLEV
jgi:fluoroacetyl-CoA thioesterase